MGSKGASWNPRGNQTRLRVDFVVPGVSNLGVFWMSFWSHFGLPDRPKCRASAHLEELKTTKVDPWAPKMPQEPPKTHPRPPKTLPRRPQGPPQTAQDACKMLPNDLKLSQDAPKTPHDLPRETKEVTRDPQDGTKRAQKDPRRTPEGVVLVLVLVLAY